MHPAPSIIVFTTLSGAGYGLLFVLAIGSALGPIPPWPGLGLVGMGLALKDSPPGFDPSAVVDSYDDDTTYVEDEQY